MIWRYSEEAFRKMGKKQKVQELPYVNLEAGMPSLAEANRAMGQFINQAKHSGIRVVKIIHGYGSSGVGGKLRIGLRQELATRKQSGKIKDFFAGERFGKTEEVSSLVEYLAGPSRTRRRAHCSRARR